MKMYQPLKKKQTVAVLAAVVVIIAAAFLAVFLSKHPAPPSADTTAASPAAPSTTEVSSTLPYSPEYDKKLMAHHWFYVSPDAGDLMVRYIFMGNGQCERVMTESDGREQKEPMTYRINGDTATVTSDTSVLEIENTSSKEVLVYRYAIPQENFYEEGILLQCEKPSYRSMAAATFLKNTRWHSDFYQTDGIRFGAPDENYVFGTVGSVDGIAQSCGVFALSNNVYSLFFEEETGNPTHIYLERTADDNVLNAYIFAKKTYDERAAFHFEKWHRV